MHVMAELVGSRAVVLPGHFPSLKKKEGEGGGGCYFVFPYLEGRQPFLMLGLRGSKNSFYAPERKRSIYAIIYT